MGHFLLNNLKFSLIAVLIISIFNGISSETLEVEESPISSEWLSWISSGLDNTYVNGISIQFTNENVPRIYNIRFHHTRPNVLSEYKEEHYYQTNINPSENSNIKWEGPKYCDRGIVTGFQLHRVQEGETIVTNDIKLICSDNSSIETGSGAPGEWTDLLSCKAHNGICGIQTQVTNAKVNDKYNTLNTLKVDCCEIPHPASTCKPSDKRKIVAECNNPEAITPKTCSYEKIIGINYAGKDVEKSIYEDLGYDLESAGKYLSQRTEFSLVGENYDYSNMASIVWSPETITMDSLTAQPKTNAKLEQIIGYCGFYKLYTPFFRTELGEVNQIKENTEHHKHNDHDTGNKHHHINEKVLNPNFYDTKDMLSDGFMEESWEDNEPWDSVEAELKKAEHSEEKVSMHDRKEETKEVSGEIWSDDEDSTKSEEKDTPTNTNENEKSPIVTELKKAENSEQKVSTNDREEVKEVSEEARPDEEESSKSEEIPTSTKSEEVDRLPSDPTSAEDNSIFWSVEVEDTNAPTHLVEKKQEPESVNKENKLEPITLESEQDELSEEQKDMHENGTENHGRKPDTEEKAQQSVAEPNSFESFENEEPKDEKEGTKLDVIKAEQKVADSINLESSQEEDTTDEKEEKKIDDLSDVAHSVTDNSQEGSVDNNLSIEDVHAKSVKSTDDQATKPSPKLIDNSKEANVGTSALAVDSIEWDEFDDNNVVEESKPHQSNSAEKILNDSKTSTEDKPKSFSIPFGSPDISAELSGEVSNEEQSHNEKRPEPNPDPEPIDEAFDELDNKDTSKSGSFEVNDQFVNGNIPPKIETKTKTLEIVKDDDVEVSGGFNNGTPDKGALKHQDEMPKDEPEDTFEDFFPGSEEDDSNHQHEPIVNTVPENSGIQSIFSKNMEDISSKASEFVADAKKTIEEVQDMPIYQDTKNAVQTHLDTARNVVQDTVESVIGLTPASPERLGEAHLHENDEKSDSSGNAPLSSASEGTTVVVAKAGGYLGYIVGGMVVCVIVIVVIIFVIEKRSESRSTAANAEQAKQTSRQEYLKDANPAPEPLLSDTKINIEPEKAEV